MTNMPQLDPNQIQAMILMLQSMLSQQTNVSDAPSAKPKKPRSKKASNQSTSNGRINKFDSMTEKNLHKEDIEIDRKLSQIPPVPRARKFNTLNVQCRVCGKREEINPTLLSDAPDRYKCNKCSVSPG